MQHESWALDLPYTGQELVSAGVTAEVFAQMGSIAKFGKKEQGPVELSLCAKS